MTNKLYFEFLKKIELLWWQRNNYSYQSLNIVFKETELS